MGGITYKEAGVDIKEAQLFIEGIKNIYEREKNPEVFAGIGGFSALFSYDFSSMKNPLIASCADGVGTKLRIAFMSNIHNTIGIDLVAMCVNDILTIGAKPLFFLDYIGIGKIDKEKLMKVIEGVKKGCETAGTFLVGGETAQMPGFYKEDEYDIAGFAVGVVDKDDVVNGENVKEGDIILGISSSGVHSNGFSLINKVLFEIRGLDINKIYSPFTEPLYKVLLTPTKIYTKTILSLLKKIKPKSMAHITGGGICGNLLRAIPEGVSAEIWKKNIEVPEIFSFIMGKEIEEQEMWNVFNMGVGFITIIDEKNVDETIREIEKSGEKVRVIGRIKNALKKEVILK